MKLLKKSLLSSELTLESGTVKGVTLSHSLNKLAMKFI